MTLLELYNLKLHEYKETGLKEKPSKLLAMLLLSEKDKYEPLRNSEGKFYEKYKEQINQKIKIVEQDFNLTYEDLIKYIEETVECNNYEEQKIWFGFAEGFGALHWGLLYQKEKTPEEIYSRYFDSDDLKKHYDIEQRAIASNITITPLDEILEKIIECPTEFYVKISEQLTPEERTLIIQSLENKSCRSCTNGSCKVPHIEKLGVDELGNPEGSQCIGWINNELIGRSKVFKKTNIHKLT